LISILLIYILFPLIYIPSSIHTFYDFTFYMYECSSLLYVFSFLYKYICISDYLFMFVFPDESAAAITYDFLALVWFQLFLLMFTMRLSRANNIDTAVTAWAIEIIRAARSCPNTSNPAKANSSTANTLRLFLR
jgi:hypothetical protein